jgi:hypothetical protein
VTAAAAAAAATAARSAARQAASAATGESTAAAASLSGVGGSSNRDAARQRASRLHVQLIEMIRSDRAITRQLGDDAAAILPAAAAAAAAAGATTDGADNDAATTAATEASKSQPATPLATGDGAEAFAAGKSGASPLRRPSSAPSGARRGTTVGGAGGAGGGGASSSNRRSTLMHRGSGKHRQQIVYDEEEDAQETEQQRQEKLQYKADVLLLKRVYLVTNATRYVVKPNATRGFRQWILRRRAFAKVTRMLNMWCDDNFECLNVQDFVDIFYSLVPKHDKDNYRIMRSLAMSLSRMGLRLINELSGEVLQKIFEGILEMKIIAG